MLGVRTRRNTALMAGCVATTLGACRPELSAPVADATTAAVAVSRAEIHRIEGGLEIRYVLAAPTREVRFVDTGNVRDAWSVAGAGLQLHDDRAGARAVLGVHAPARP